MDSKNFLPTCADCGINACDKEQGNYPSFCLTKNLDKSLLEEALQKYREGENQLIMQKAAKVEFEGYCKETRIEDTIHFAKEINAKKIGIATCVGLIRETRSLTKVLRSHDFSVYSIACKIGAVRKTSVGIDETYCSIGNNMCNPILQAILLNKEKTDLNIVMGLCVGHDSLFYKYSDVLVTTLVAKDRVTGHNPVAPLYQLESYYQKLLKK